MKRLGDGVDVQGKRPSLHLYPKDVEEELSLLSLPAAGLWTRMFLMMHFSPHRGFLELPSGEPMTDGDIARKFGQTVPVVRKLLRELEHVGTFSRDERDCIFNRRMVRDEAITQQRRAAGKRGGNPALLKQQVKQEVKQQVNPEADEGLRPPVNPKPTLSYPSPFSSSPSGTPPPPSFADWLAKIRDRHPNPSQFQIGVQRLTERPSVEDPKWREHFTEVHVEWCKYWLRDKGGKFAPKFADFVENFEAYEKGPPKPVVDDSDNSWAEGLEESA
jgi:hypothetical protein